MTRMTGPDCTVMCNSINPHTHTNTHTHTHNHTHTHTHTHTGRGGGGRRGHRGGGVRQQEQLEDPLATQSDGGMELSQTNRGVG